MSDRKPTPERKSRSGSYVPDSLRGTVRVVVRCSPELAERARKAAKGTTLAALIVAGCRALEICPACHSPVATPFAGCRHAVHSSDPSSEDASI